MTTIDLRAGKPSLTGDDDDNVVRCLDRSAKRRAWVARITAGEEAGQVERAFITGDTTLLRGAREGERAFPIRKPGVYEVELHRAKRVFFDVGADGVRLLTLTAAMAAIGDDAGRDDEGDAARAEGNAAELRGTSKQVAWARTIRLSFLKRIAMLPLDLRNTFDVDVAASVTLTAKLVIAMREIDTAQWWIERGSRLLREVAVEAGAAAGVSLPPRRKR